MTGIVILSAAPIAVCAAAYFARRFDAGKLFCVFCALFFFALFGFGSGGEEYSRISLMYDTPAVQAEFIEGIQAPVGSALLMKLFSLFINDPRGYVLVVSLLESAAAALFMYFECSEPYSAGVVFTFCFAGRALTDSTFFIAALICAHSFVYIRERRFIRFSAVILLAACFEPCALILLPLYWLFLIPAFPATAALSGLLFFIPVFFPELCAGILEFTDPFNRYNETRHIACGIILAAAALIFIAASAMFTKRDEYYGRLTPVFFAGALCTLASAFEPGLVPLSFMLAMPSAVILAPEARAIGRTFFDILFPRHKETARRIFLGTCLIIMFTFYFFDILSADTVTGGFASAFITAS